jgi:hypothetical protein
VLAVGDSTDVEIIFNTGHYSSKTNKSASIISNSQAMAPALSISAFPVKSMDSLKVFTISPALVSLDSLRPEEQKNPWEYEFAIRNVSSEELDLSLVSAPHEYVEVNMPGGSLSPGSEKTIRVKVDQTVADQLFNRSFTLEASDTARTRITVPISKAMRWGPAPTSN